MGIEKNVRYPNKTVKTIAGAKNKYSTHDPDRSRPLYFLLGIPIFCLTSEDMANPPYTIALMIKSYAFMHNLSITRYKEK